ncbi:MAG: DivIVA domain-containing protein [bacterium]|nr:DivIVA domain-containing protein [bacterium]
MKLSPILIKKQEFEKSMRGYNVEEVQAFLEKLSTDIEELLNENEQLQNEVNRLKSELDNFHRIEQKLQEKILKTEEASAQTIEAAKKQSAVIIKEAEIKASQVIQNAEEKANQLQNAIMVLREEKDLIIARLKAIVGSQANLLEGKVKDAGQEPKKPVVKEKPQKLDIDVDGIVDKLL